MLLRPNGHYMSHIQISEIFCCSCNNYMELMELKEFHSQTNMTSHFSGLCLIVRDLIYANSQHGVRFFKY